MSTCRRTTIRDCQQDRVSGPRTPSRTEGTARDFLTLAWTAGVDRQTWDGESCLISEGREISSIYLVLMIMVVFVPNPLPSILLHVRLASCSFRQDPAAAAATTTRGAAGRGEEGTVPDCKLAAAATRVGGASRPADTKTAAPVSRVLSRRAGASAGRVAAGGREQQRSRRSGGSSRSNRRLARECLAHA